MPPPKRRVPGKAGKDFGAAVDEVRKSVAKVWRKRRYEHSAVNSECGGGSGKRNPDCR